MHVAILSTGGTIASAKDPSTGLQVPGSLTGEMLLSASGLDMSVLKYTVSIHSVFQIPSNHMTFNHADQLIKRMETMLLNGQADAFVITHGTDTMDEIAFYLDLHWNHLAPVVITGAQVTPNESNTDSFYNLQAALSVAACGESRGRGVQLVFNGRIFNARYVNKWHTSNIDGFGSVQTGPEGAVDLNEVFYYHKPANRIVFPPISTETDSNVRVEIVTSYVDADPSIINHWVQAAVSALVIAGVGRGQTSVPLSREIKRAVQGGMPIVITSSTGSGFVAPVYGYEGSLNDLLDAGAIAGFDYTAKKARVLLYSIIASGMRDKNEIASKFHCM